MKNYTRRAEDALRLSLSYNDVFEFYLNKIKSSCKNSVYHVFTQRLNRLQAIKDSAEAQLVSLSTEGVGGFIMKIKKAAKIRSLKKELSAIKNSMTNWVKSFYLKFAA